MLDKKEFRNIQHELKDFEANREKLIQQSRDIISVSKQLIYALHRNDLKKADKLAIEIRKAVKILPDQEYETGMRRVALQEYVEALCYYSFIQKKKIPSRKELDIDTNSYLLGLCDLSGELVRKAVNDVINGHIDEASEICGLVSDIYESFLEFDLRNGELRKKSDSLKWNLNKLEDIMYDLKVKKR